MGFNGEEMIDLNIGGRLASLHDQLRQTCGGLGRISVALYDPETDSLHSFVDSTDITNPLKHYQTPLSNVPSLKKLAETGESRIIEDLSVLADSTKEHTKKILSSGYQSSYTVPIITHGKFIGFLFFDSKDKAFFSSTLQVNLSVYAQLVTSMIANDIVPIRTLKGAVKMAREFSRFRDEETASHLSRMSHYARMIAQELADQYSLTEEFIEFILQFAPLHDVGKVAISDQILLKNGPLNEEETKIMRTHVSKGVEIIDVMIKEFDLDSIHHTSVLRNIIAYHHECYDGSGYPNGLQGQDIPLEGRITAVADVFDALTSKRPYKEAWHFDEALEYMVSNVGKKYDPDCVQAIQDNVKQMMVIHDRFKGDAF